MSTKLCPFCAEEIQAAAIKCRFCGEFLSKSQDVYVCGPCEWAGCTVTEHRCDGHCVGPNVFRHPCGLPPLPHHVPPATNQQDVVEYKSYKDFERDQSKRLQNGWRVVGMSDTPQRPGAVRMALISPIGAYIWKPKPHVFVVYERDR